MSANGTRKVGDGIVLGESPIAKPANHDPSVNIVCPDPDPVLEPEPGYPYPETEYPYPLPE